MKWWIVVFAVGIALDIFFYLHASKAAQNDIRVITYLGALAISAFGALKGATWLMYKIEPTTFPRVALGVGAALIALAWTGLVFYIYVRVLINSFNA